MISLVSTVAAMVFPLLMAFAASSDLLTMRISNRVVLLLAATFFAVALLIGMPLEQLGIHVLAAVATLAIGFAFFAFGWMGGGDAKLAAATVLWIGLAGALPYLLYASLLGGALTLVIVLLRARPLPPLLARVGWIERLHDPKAGVPYGIALAGAGLVVYAHSGIFQSLLA